MTTPHSRRSLPRKAAAFAVAVAFHGLVVAGLLQVRAAKPPAVASVPIQVSFIDTRDEPAPTEPMRVPVVPVKLVLPTLPEIPLPIVASTPEPVTAITVSAPPPTPTPVKAVSDDSPALISTVEYVKPPAPRYPVKARRTHAEGVVLLKVLIDVAGNAAEVIVHRSSGHDELDVAARDAVLAAKFLPYVENGRPRSAHVIIPIDFSLSVRTAARS